MNLGRLTSTIFVIIGLLLLNYRPGYVRSEQNSDPGDIGSSGTLWVNTIGQIIDDALWSTRDAYDTGHIFMVPLHYAFVANDEKAIYDFEKLFARFSRQEEPYGQLNQVHWLYLVSRYLALKIEFGKTYNSADHYLVSRLSNYVVTRWLFLPSFQWDRYPFLGVKARLDFVLSSEVPDSPSYYKAVTDNEMFLFAIASDLSYIFANTDSPVDGTFQMAVVPDMTKYLLRILRERGVFTQEDGWLFQQGVWVDHPDFLYSGHTELAPDLPPKKRANIAEDSSHSHRWPLWLRSFMMAAQSCNDKIYLQDIYQGLSTQFVKHVGVWDGTSGYLKLNNFIDGWNGIYRYQYETLEVRLYSERKMRLMLD